MKIRRDFITNSSSSSYIIAFRGFSKIDEDTLEKYPFMVQYQMIAEKLLMDGDGANDYCSETTEAEVADNIVDLRDLLAENCGYEPDEFEDMLSECECIKSIYEEAKKKLDDGYKILFKDVGYDDIRNELFKNIQSDDFVILNCD